VNEYDKLVIPREEDTPKFDNYADYLIYKYKKSRTHEREINTDFINKILSQVDTKEIPEEHLEEYKKKL
jgi:hypothetical protein